jgi:hypothetical protein
MRRWFPHAVFAALLVASLSARLRAADVLAAPADLEPAVQRLLEADGLAYKGREPLKESDVRALVFEAPGCTRQLIVISLAITFEEERILRIAGAAGAGRRYVYIDRSWAAPNPVEVFLTRMRHAALAMIGLSPYVPSPRMLLVDEPPDCPRIQSIDWRAVWGRDYLVQNGGTGNPAVGSD